jgi:hypothetical protein
MTEFHDRVITMLMDGARDCDLIRDGIVTGAVLQYVKRKARARGVVFPRSNTRWKVALPMGSLRNALCNLTDDEARWLLRNVPRRVTIAEFCAALIKDAAAEN